MRGPVASDGNGDAKSDRIFLFRDRLDRVFENPGIAYCTRETGTSRTRVSVDLDVLGQHSKAPNCSSFDATSDSNWWVFLPDLFDFERRRCDGKLPDWRTVVEPNDRLLVSGDD